MNFAKQIGRVLAEACIELAEDFSLKPKTRASADTRNNPNSWSSARRSQMKPTASGKPPVRNPLGVADFKRNKEWSKSVGAGTPDVPKIQTPATKKSIARHKGGIKEAEGPVQSTGFAKGIPSKVGDRMPFSVEFVVGRKQHKWDAQFHKSLEDAKVSFEKDVKREYPSAKILKVYPYKGGAVRTS